MMGNFAQALMFTITLVALALVGSFAYLYGSRCFLVILEQTAGGEDDLTWPDEPITDWISKGIYLIWLVALWCIPVWAIWQLVAPTVLPILVYMGVMVGVMWLVFPFSLLSSLSAVSPLLAINPPVIGKLFRHPISTLIVYLVSAGLIAGLAGLGWVLLTKPGWIWALPAGLGGALFIFLYGRLLGRLGWVISGAGQRKKNKGKRGPIRWKEEEEDDEDDDLPHVWNMPKPPQEDPPKKEPPRPPSSAPSPAGKARDLDEEDEWAPPKPYILMPEEKATDIWKNPRLGHNRRTEAEADPFGLLPPEGKPLPVPEEALRESRGLQLPRIPIRDDLPATTLPPDLDNLPQGKSRVGILERQEEKALQLPPARAMWSGVYTFPFYSSSLGPLLTNTLFLVCVAGLVKALTVLMPSE